MTSMRRIACLTLLALLLGARAYAGPILDYGFFALNLAENAQQFVFTFQSPYALGPYDTLIHEFSSTVTDADGNGGVTVIPTFASMSIPTIDGVDIGAAGLGSGCAPIDAPGFIDLTCDAFSSTSVAVSTAANGVFSATVAFTLSGGDSISGSGHMELKRVPEPASLMLLGTGIAAAAARRRSRERQ